MKTLKPKERMAIPRQDMPEQDADRRRNNYEEVPHGFSPETAVEEARRCLNCKKPKCIEGCPVNIDIPAFVKLIEAEDYIGAAKKLKETNTLPAVTGRVCPQETQCECLCVAGKKGEPVSIGRLERFAADYERNAGAIELPEVAPPTGKKVAIVGSGPAGLTVAGDLVKLGHQVTIYEALHLTGGVLMYGIPEFRLPKEIVQTEISFLTRLGVEIVTDFVVGMADSVDKLLEGGFDSVFIGSGAGLPMFMRIPGENLVGVFSANEYLTRSNLMKAFKFPEYGTPPVDSKKVVTVGGGNVAMDSARTALRLGSESTIRKKRRLRRGRHRFRSRNGNSRHGPGQDRRAVDRPLPQDRTQPGSAAAAGREEEEAEGGSNGEGGAGGENAEGGQSGQGGLGV